LLDEKVEKDEIDKDTTWKSAKLCLVSDQRYRNMLEDTEASAEQLFLDLIENLQESYDADKIKIKSFLKDEEKQIEPTMLFSEFSALIMGHSDYAHIAQRNMLSIFEEFQKKAIRKSEKESKKRKNDEALASTKKLKLSENSTENILCGKIT
jgi:hypothetical protein